MSSNKKRFGFFRRDKIDSSNTSNSKRNESIQQNQHIFIQAPIGYGTGTNIRQPILSKTIDNEENRDEFIEDPEIMRLQLVMMQRTPQNIKWIFNHDNSCQTASFVLTHAVIGSKGLTVKTENDKLKQVLEDYFNTIDASNIMLRAIRDNLCFTESVWWKEYDKELNMIIPKRIDYVNLTKVTNSYTGESKWVQVTHVDSKMPEKNGAEWKTYEPMLDYYHTSQWVTEEPKDKPVKIHIMEEDVLNFQFFASPPILAVLDVIIWKKWMEYDAKLAGQKYATPLVDVAVETPDSYDLSSTESKNLMDSIADDLNRLMNFGVMAHPAKIKVATINQQGQVFNFTNYLERADKQIHKAILVPANLLDAAGSELATSRTTKDMFIITINALRNRFAKKFKDLAMEYLDFIGRKFKKDEFEIIFSEADSQQQLTQLEEFNALMQMYDRGMIKDPNEVRAYVKKFNMDLPQLTDQELEEKEQQMQPQQEQPTEEENQTEIEKDNKPQEGEGNKNE